MSAGEPESEKSAYLILETTERAPIVAFREVLLVLDMTGE